MSKKITMSQTESWALEELMRRTNMSLSEILVTSALAPDKRISRAEAEHMMSTMNEARKQIGDLVVEVRKVSDSGCSSEEYEEALTSFFNETKLVMDALFNSVYTLAI